MGEGEARLSDFFLQRIQPKKNFFCFGERWGGGGADGRGKLE